MRRPLIAGNWKMNGSKARVGALLQDLKRGCEQVEAAELLVLVPDIFLEQTESCLMKTQIAWGAQDVSQYDNGAFTGEVSVGMLQDFNCSYVIVGHSERRQYFAESNAVVASKFHKVLSGGLSPILCVGETEAQRLAGKTEEVVAQQLDAVLEIADNPAALSQVVIAYEPVWAIGTGKQATVSEIQAVHAVLRARLSSAVADLGDKVRILYGGSVKPDNAAAIFAMPDVDGGLIGGASLHADQFLEIARLCNNLY